MLNASTSKADFVRSQPLELSLDTLVLRADEAGIKLGKPYASFVRTQMRKTPPRRSGGSVVSLRAAISERARKVYDFCAAHLKEHGEGHGPRMPDIVKGTGLPNGSVSTMLKELRRRGYVSYEPGDYTSILVLKALPEPGAEPETAAAAKPKRTRKKTAKPAAKRVRVRRVPLPPPAARAPTLASSVEEHALIVAIAQVGVVRARAVLDDFAVHIDALVRRAR